MQCIYKDSIRLGCRRHEADTDDGFQEYIGHLTPKSAGGQSLGYLHPRGPMQTTFSTGKDMFSLLLGDVALDQQIHALVVEPISQIPTLSMTLLTRAKHRPSMITAWLHGRSDLHEYAELLASASYLGLGCFSSVACWLAVRGGCQFTRALRDSSALSSTCLACFIKRCGKVKLEARRKVGRDEWDCPEFLMQYADQLAGRLDHPLFSDTEEDRQERVDISKLTEGQPQWWLHIGKAINQQFTAAWNKRGTQFGNLIANRH